MSWNRCTRYCVILSRNSTYFIFFHVVTNLPLNGYGRYSYHRYAIEVSNLSRRTNVMYSDLFFNWEVPVSLYFNIIKMLREASVALKELSDDR